MSRTADASVTAHQVDTSSTATSADISSEAFTAAATSTLDDLDETTPEKASVVVPQILSNSSSGKPAPVGIIYNAADKNNSPGQPKKKVGFQLDADVIDDTEIDLDRTHAQEISTANRIKQLWEPNSGSSGGGGGGSAGGGGKSQAGSKYNSGNSFKADLPPRFANKDPWKLRGMQQPKHDAAATPALDGGGQDRREMAVLQRDRYPITSFPDNGTASFGAKGFNPMGMEQADAALESHQAAGGEDMTVYRGDLRPNGPVINVANGRSGLGGDELQWRLAADMSTTVPNQHVAAAGASRDVNNVGDNSGQMSVSDSRAMRNATMWSGQASNGAAPLWNQADAELNADCWNARGDAPNNGFPGSAPTGSTNIPPFMSAAAAAGGVVSGQQQPQQNQLQQQQRPFGIGPQASQLPFPMFDQVHRPWSDLRPQQPMPTNPFQNIHPTLRHIFEASQRPQINVDQKNMNGNNDNIMQQPAAAPGNLRFQQQQQQQQQQQMQAAMMQQHQQQQAQALANQNGEFPGVNSMAVRMPAHMAGLANQRPPFSMSDSSANQKPAARAPNPGMSMNARRANDMQAPFQYQEKNSFGIDQDTGRFGLEQSKVSEQQAAYNKMVRFVCFLFRVTSVEFRIIRDASREFSFFA